jgi:HlyD family secretion protein
MKQRFLSTHAATLAWPACCCRCSPCSPCRPALGAAGAGAGDRGHGGKQAVAPALFGIGTVEARYTYKIGPTFAGRVRSVEVQVGDRVRPASCWARWTGRSRRPHRRPGGALRRAEAGVLAAEAQVQEWSARKTRFAETQASRYEKLLAARSVSEEAVEAKRQELQVAEAGLPPRAPIWRRPQELVRVRAERDGLLRQRANLRLVAPVAGWSARDADPGTTVVAGQAVVEVIDPASVWINVRFDQHGRAARAARRHAGAIVLRRLAGALPGGWRGSSPLADAVTEETWPRSCSTPCPSRCRPSANWPRSPWRCRPLPARPVVPNASVQRLGRPARRLGGRGRLAALRAGQDWARPTSTAGCRFSTGSRRASAWWSTARRRSPPTAASRWSSACRESRHDQPGRTRHPAFLGQVRLHRRGAGPVDRRDADHGRRLSRHGGRRQGAARQQRRRPVGGAAGHAGALCRSVQPVRRHLSRHPRHARAWRARPTSPT